MPRVLVERLSVTEIELVRAVLMATVDGPFFDDAEFQTLMGVERDEVRRVQMAWPTQTVDDVTFECAIFNSMVNLVGYPHHRRAELSVRVPGGEKAIEALLTRLREVGA